MVDVRILIAIVVVLVVAVAVYAYRKSRPAPPPSDAKYDSGAPSSCTIDSECRPGTCVDGKCADSALGAFTAAAAASAAALSAGVTVIVGALANIETGAASYADPSMRNLSGYTELWNTSQYPAIDAATAALTPVLATAKTLAKGYLNEHEKLFTIAEGMPSYAYMTASDAAAYETLATAAASGAVKLAASVTAVCKATIALLNSTYYVTVGQINNASKMTVAHDLVNNALKLIAGPSEMVAAEGPQWTTKLVPGTSTLDVAALAAAAAADAGTLVAHFH